MFTNIRQKQLQTLTKCRRWIWPYLVSVVSVRPHFWQKFGNMSTKSNLSNVAIVPRKFYTQSTKYKKTLFHSYRIRNPEICSPAGMFFAAAGRTSLMNRTSLDALVMAQMRSSPSRIGSQRRGSFSTYLDLYKIKRNFANIWTWNSPTFCKRTLTNTTTYKILNNNCTSRTK